MFDITFYNFSKNENSTKVVDVDGDTFKCVLIEPTDIINPRIALNHGNPTNYNYARIPIFNRYYFVNNWSWSGGRWVALLNVDVLASFKDEIGSKRQYVVRSSFRSDGDIIDTLYPTKNNTILNYTSGTVVDGGGQNPFKYSLADGRFIVGIINGDSSAVGCVSYYSFTNAQFRALCNKLMGTTDWMYMGIEEISEELTKVIFNPFQYIASCVWLPITGIGGTSTTVKYGWWDLGVSATRISGGLSGGGIAFEIPKHPQIARGSYLNGAPFTRHFLDWACFGRIALDANVLKNFDSVIADYSIDPVTGICTLRIAPGGIPIYTQQTQVGVPIQIAQMASDYIGAVGNMVGGVVDAFRLDIGGVFDSIGDAVQSAMPNVSTIGKNGTISAFRFAPVLVTEFYMVVDDDVAHRGRPLMQDVVLNTIPGYIICSDAELECSCTSNELQNIKSYLNGGFYYE